jgi:hypothetical protein
METVVKYALWVRKGFERSGNGDVLLKQGFDAMPEVKKVLNKHLDVNAEPSITIRAVYGAYFPWLHLLDARWAEEHTARILPRDRPEFWHAAWDTYLCHCVPYDSVFKWLKNEYSFAVQQVGAHEHGWETPEAPDYSLAQHLMTSYFLLARKAGGSDGSPRRILPTGRRQATWTGTQLCGTEPAQY